ncbi:MAG TPA: DUF2231 domain-containing protein [Polyangiales bacterium]|nr:DUF2231 domain-containing protein [Polyangiales bacterium]
MRRPTHPLHTVFVHFPIALLGTSLAFDLLGLARDEASWWAISYWNIALGLAVSVITMVTGLIDSMRVPQDSPAAAIVTRHMIAMLAALSCYGAALAFRPVGRPPTAGALVATLALEGVGLGLLLLGGFLGGELVYRHGVGVAKPGGSPS